MNNQYLPDDLTKMIMNINTQEIKKEKQQKEMNNVIEEMNNFQEWTDCNQNMDMEARAEDYNVDFDDEGWIEKIESYGFYIIDEELEITGKDILKTIRNGCWQQDYP